MQKILITGIPGMGKTTLGNKLKELYGFEHIEIESSPEVHESLINDEEIFFNRIMDSQKDFVITWGFYPPNSNSKILFLKRKGFKLIWLDGNRESALREYTKRCKINDPQHLQLHLEAFHKQIKRINDTNVIKKINPIEINTFNESGKFRSFDEIISEILINQLIP